jgi:hypothetical protein
MPGATTAPAASRTKVESTRVVTTGTPNLRHSLRNGLWLIPRSPRCTGLCSHRRPPSSLASLISASGDQDHTALPSALVLLVLRNQRVHRIPHPTSVTIAIRPSLRKRDGDTISMICVSDKANYFCRRGLTGFAKASPTGKSAEVSYCDN